MSVSEMRRIREKGGKGVHLKRMENVSRDGTALTIAPLITKSPLRRTMSATAVQGVELREYGGDMTSFQLRCRT